MIHANPCPGSIEAFYAKEFGRAGEAATGSLADAPSAVLP